ncbi:MAG: hypothetical protein HY033_07335, partial [Ignavibacteriae bacterium]|nr:hypothetical protein [Ignavibacteriota bacterium]
ASYKVFLKEEYRTTGKADEIQQKVQSVSGVDKVIYRRDMLEFIERQNHTLQTIGMVLGMLIGISAIFLVSNTIRLTIDTKRKTIQTMKLVGASRWFVRAPFILEGILQGLMGGIIAAAMIYYVLAYAAGIVSSDLSEFLRTDSLFYASLIGVGVALGFFGSAVSVRRFIGETVSP